MAQAIMINIDFSLRNKLTIQLGGIVSYLTFESNIRVYVPSQPRKLNHK